MGTDRLRAVICTRRDGGASRRVADCFAHCKRRGYRVVGAGGAPVVLFDWNEAMAMVLSGQADVIVVHDHDDPPPDRVPRWEAVTDAPRERGPRRLRRLY